MTTTVPATPIPNLFGLSTVADHLSAVFARPAPCPRRFDLFWSTLQPTNPTNAPAGQNDTWNPAVLDNIHTQAVASGIGYVVLTLGYVQMAWAGGSGDGHMVPRDAANGCRDLANINRLCSAYWHAQGYDDNVTVYWSLWNEWQNGFMGPVPGDASLMTTYIKMLQARADACRNGNILGRSGTLAHYTSGGDLWIGGTGAGPAVGTRYRHLNCVQSIVDADPDCFDHFDMHLYSGGCPLGTPNGYDPGYNDFDQALAYCAAHGRPDAQGNCGEGGWFNRDDSTPSQADCGNNCNCNSYGSGSNVNEHVEVTVTTQAQRIAALGPFWKGRKGAGIYCLYQQDTTAPNNTDTDGSGGPSAAFNHAGLYGYDPARAGTPTLDHLGNPAPLNAFLALQTADTTPPVIVIEGPTASQVVTGTFAIAAGVTDAVTAAASLKVKWGLDGTHYPNALPYVSPAFGVNRLSPQDSAGGSWPNGAYTVHIRAIDAAGNKSFASVAFTVNNAAPGPVVTSATPANGDIGGATSVVIAGTSFTGATAVMFGATPAASFTVDSDIQITAVSPAGVVGTVDITVTIPGPLTSPIAAGDQFTYTTTTPTPTVTGVAPNTGDISGATSVVITGTGFSPATAVKFGPTAAASFTIDSSTQITAVSPAVATPGTVPIRVLVGSLRSPLGPADKYTFTTTPPPGLPSVTGASPSSGDVAGGTSVALTGTGFEV